MNGYNFTLSDALVFNDSVVNGTAGYASAYVVVAGLDLLLVVVFALLVVSLITLAFVIMGVDLK